MNKYQFYANERKKIYKVISELNDRKEQINKQLKKYRDFYFFYHSSHFEHDVLIDIENGYQQELKQIDEQIKYLDKEFEKCTFEMQTRFWVRNKKEGN